MNESDVIRSYKGCPPLIMLPILFLSFMPPMPGSRYEPFCQVVKIKTVLKEMNLSFLKALKELTELTGCLARFPVHAIDLFWKKNCFERNESEFLEVD